MLILEERSLFDPPKSIEEKEEGWLVTVAKKFLPPMGHNLNARGMYEKFLNLLPHSEGNNSTVFVIGAGRGGIGISYLASRPDVCVINMDVVPNRTLDVIGDGHNLPVADESVDGVVIQAVLEHVLDPWRVVSEISRILRPEGIVYAETPFMQMVHERAYDYTRFSDLGHRHLFRDFVQIERGITGGPGMTLLWAWCYFLRSFFRRKSTASIALAIGRLTGFWLLWVDRILRDMPGAYDACSGVYFMGKKSLTTPALDDRRVPREFRGL